MSDTSSDTDTPADPADQAAPVVDQKAAFKAALDRKNAAAHARNQSALEGDNQISGDSHAAGAKRQFRRKSGG